MKSLSLLRSPLLLLAATFLAAGFVLPALATDTDNDKPEPEPIPVTELLAAGPVAVPLPAFHDQEKGGVKTADLLKDLPVLPQNSWPRAGDAFAGPDGSVKWRKAKGDLKLSTPKSGAAVHYLAFVVTADRWQKVSLQVTGDHAVSAALDGEPIALTEKKNRDEEPALRCGDLKLSIGKHLVTLVTLYDPATDAPWKLQTAVVPDGEAGPGTPTFGVDPVRHVDIGLVLDAPRIAGASLSPDGELAAVALGEYRDGKNKESWIEIRTTADGELVHLWRGEKNPGRVSWNPVGRRLAWQTSADDKTTVWLLDLDAGRVEPVLADVEHLGSWRWTPDGASLIYEISRSPDPDPRKVKRVLHPADRQSWWRGRSHLMQVFLPGGMTRRLTAGPVSPESWEISPDGRKLLFFLNEPDHANRPYYSSTMYLMDLQTLAAQKILADYWIGGAVFSPDGKTLCLQGSPSAFDGLGRNLPEGVVANDYGGQLYLYGLQERKPRPITIDLVPDVSGVEWSAADGLIYARTTDTQFGNYYRCDPDAGKWEKVDTGFEVTSELTLPRKGTTAIARGTSATMPNRLHAVDLKQNRSRLLLDPGAAAYRDIVFGKVEGWKCTLPKGMELDGLVYYPPDYDESKKYPVIVYYYGGTSPITRDFGGRYPKNVWVGEGYIVYVPEPSGATGYGQEFAARHVNDWGRLTAGEVIEGTKAFLAAHPSADAERVACMGASYGGFLTEYVITQTDLFAAAVSHAGISSISSYWGEGLWGYVYGARALADAFPWNDRDLYVEQSALFHADKITTPLLLVHGDSDTNVPVGESDQLFTALKLLDREVEYVQIQGQDHWILDHDQRIVWNDTILAFLAKHLKGRPGWWDALYPEPEDYR